jgi:O-antigen/teichoic acid export membrane protein
MLLAGVLDAALSSLATFGSGLYAARLLTPVELGGYALAGNAFGVAMSVPAQMAFTPLEIIAVSGVASSRLPFLRRSVMLGLLPAFLPAIAGPLWALVAPSTISTNIVVALTITGVGYAFLSPVQDHLRRMLHIAGESWYAALVSAVQLVVVAGVLVVWRIDRLPSAWAPFGALAVANLISLVVGMLLARRRETSDTELPIARMADVLRSGRWLLISTLVPTGAAFVAAAIAIRLAGAAILGYAEVARLGGQPLLVLSTGLSSTLGPRVVAAAQRRRPREARHITRVYVVLILVLGALYLAIAGPAWRWNPIEWLLPKAYVIPGLVAATILANVTHGISFPVRSEILGAGKEQALAKVELVGNAVRVAIAGAAGALGAFVIPAGVLAVGSIRWLGCHMELRPYYATRRP